jgi:TonB family protein
MQCLWPSTKGSFVRPIAGALLVAGLAFAVARSEVPATTPSVSSRTPLAQLERALRRAPAHISEFAPLAHTSALRQCADIHPPEALLTPDPLLQVEDEDLRVRVSFIVGSDGLVHSAFILDSGGPIEDQTVLRAIRNWRYRPALCNGVPTDYEALVRFSVR